MVDFCDATTGGLEKLCFDEAQCKIPMMFAFNSARINWGILVRFLCIIRIEKVQNPGEGNPSISYNHKREKKSGTPHRHTPFPQSPNPSHHKSVRSDYWVWMQAARIGLASWY